MGSNSIIHGFSASQPSSSYRLRPPPADDFPLSRSTLLPKRPITGKKSHQSCLGGSLADDDEEAEIYGKRVSEDAIDDDGSSDWEDSVSEHVLHSIDGKETFPMQILQPVVVSRPSLLTAIMHQSPPLTGHPAKTIDTRRTDSPPALRRLPIEPTGPSLTTPQDDDGSENFQTMRALRIADSELGTATSSLPISNTLSPTTTRENLLSDELDESLKGYMRWEHKQKNATANAFLSRQPEAHRLFAPEENSSGNHVLDKAESWCGIGFHSGPSSAIGKPHENHPWNQYFDNETSNYHVQGW